MSHSQCGTSRAVKTLTFETLTTLMWMQSSVRFGAVFCSCSVVGSVFFLCEKRKLHKRTDKMFSVVVDMSNMNSIKLAGIWKQEFMNKATTSQEAAGASAKEPFDPNDIPVLLVGNKYDLVSIFKPFLLGCSKKNCNATTRFVHTCRCWNNCTEHNWWNHLMSKNSRHCWRTLRNKTVKRQMFPQVWILFLKVQILHKVLRCIQLGVRSKPSKEQTAWILIFPESSSRLPAGTPGIQANDLVPGNSGQSEPSTRPNIIRIRSC